MSERQKYLQRILNLRELGSRTSSEAEAMAAMAAAERLMHSLRITEAELVLAEATGEISVEIVHEYQSGIRNGRNRHKVQACVWGIERFCEVEVVITDGGSKLHWIGDKPDVELAMYLVDLLRGALDREYSLWSRRQQAVGRGAKGAFQTAMASRINDRLSEMTRSRKKEREQALRDAQRLLDVPAAQALGLAVANGNLKQLTSTALVMVSAAHVKQEAVRAAFKVAYGHTRLGKASGFSARGSASAYSAGRAAGDRVSFGRPLGGASQARLN